MDQKSPRPDDVQFTPAELLTIIETFEIAIQTDGFIDTTSSGACSPDEKAAILADMRHVLHKARGLGETTTGHPTAPSQFES